MAEKELFDCEQLYDCLNQYITYCLENPEKVAKGKDKTKKRKKDDSEQELIDERLANYEAMIKIASKGGIESLSTFVDALIKIKEDKPELDQKIQSILAQKEILMWIKELRDNLLELYPVLDKINNSFDVEKYYELSLLPNSSIYGSEIEEGLKKPPLRNEDIIKMLELFLEKKDSERFSIWIKAILLFSTAKIVDGYQNYISERNDLKKWIKEEIISDENYRQGLSQELVEEILVAFYEKDKTEKAKEIIENKNQDLSERIDVLEKDLKEYVQNKNSLEEEIRVLSNKLNDKENDYKQILDRLDYIYEKAGVLEKERDELKESIVQREEELTKKEKELEDLKIKNIATESDLRMKNNESQKLKDETNRIEKKAQSEIKKELIEGFNDRLYYLTLFYFDLLDNGKLSEENIELYSNTLNEIEDVFGRIGIKKIGLIDEEVKYDSSVYCTDDTSIADGDSVIVKGFGWIIGDEVYIKAPVEKGE